MNTYTLSLRAFCKAFMLGVMLTLSFAPFNIFPLAILAPAGFLMLIANHTPQQSFKLGFILGLGWFSTGIYWVYISIHTFGGTPIMIAALITFGLIALLSLFPAFVAYCTNRFFPANETPKLVFAFPAIWVLSEWVRSWICGGFPWLLIGYSQNHSPLKGYAPILSVYGVTFAVLISSGLLVNALRQYQQAMRAGAKANLFILAVLWSIGGLLSFIPWTTPTGRPISVSLVQGNIPQSLKWSPEHVQLSLDRYASLTAQSFGKSQLIIWPEIAVPLPLQDVKAYLDTLEQQAKIHNSHLILGIPIEDPYGKGYYNGLISLGENEPTYQHPGENRPIYKKRQLVPFGEYIPTLPFASLIMKSMDIPMSTMVPGNMNQAPILINGLAILPSICYEIAYPELIHSNNPHIGVLLTVTNDAWFGASSAQTQHLQMAAMRALELKRSLLFAGNNGITAIINPDGNIVNMAPIDEAVVLQGNIQAMTGLTPWMRYGMETILFLVLISLFTAIKLQTNPLTLVTLDAENKTI